MEKTRPERLHQRLLGGKQPRHGVGSHLSAAVDICLLLRTEKPGGSPVLFG